MERTQRLNLNEVISASAEVVIELDHTGTTREARFDLSGLPRIEGLLIGRPVVDVPGIVERLCGICPAAHHLAGVAALDELHGISALPDTAVAVRRLLHLGANVANHAPRFADVDREGALLLVRFGKNAMKVAGSPGHFPASALPGGVRAPAAEDQVAMLATALEPALEVATRMATALLDLESQRPNDIFPGADVALVDRDGNPNPCGGLLRARARDGRVLIDGVSPSQWPDMIRESRPGDRAPRPFLTALGADRGRYRVGPVSQLRVGDVPTPVAARLQHTWRRRARGAAAARGVATVYALELIAATLSDPALVVGRASEQVPPVLAARVGTGWVDGPRGLLVHSYQADAEGNLAYAQIITPTAQNESWLAELLRTAADDPASLSDASTRRRLKSSVREADPCLPCSSGPEDAMDLRVTVTGPTEGGA